jgi:hypothetical protein
MKFKDAGEAVCWYIAKRVEDGEMGEIYNEMLEALGQRVDASFVLNSTESLIALADIGGVIERFQVNEQAALHLLGLCGFTHAAFCLHRNPKLSFDDVYEHVVEFEKDILMAPPTTGAMNLRMAKVVERFEKMLGPDYIIGMKPIFLRKNNK